MRIFAIITILFCATSAHAGWTMNGRCTIPGAHSDAPESPAMQALLSAKSVELVIGHSRVNIRFRDEEGHAVHFILNDDDTIDSSSLFQLSGGGAHQSNPNEYNYGSRRLFVIRQAEEENFFDFSVDSKYLRGYRNVDARIETVKNTVLTMTCR